jgi:hypothetical protein
MRQPQALAAFNPSSKCVQKLAHWSIISLAAQAVAGGYDE